MRLELGPVERAAGPEPVELGVGDVVEAAVEPEDVPAALDPHRVAERGGAGLGVGVPDGPLPVGELIVGRRRLEPAVEPVLARSSAVASSTLVLSTDSPVWRCGLSKQPPENQRRGGAVDDLDGRRGQRVREHLVDLDRRSSTSSGTPAVGDAASIRSRTLGRVELDQRELGSG